MTNLLQGSGFFDPNFWGGYRVVGLNDYDQVHNMAQIIGAGNSTNFILTPMSGRNLMTNTNNFANLTGWSLNEGSAVTGSIALSTDPTYGSVIHAQLTTNATSGSNWWLIQGTGITLPNKHFTVGQTYTASFMLQNDFPMYLDFEDSNGSNPVASSMSIPASATWRKVVYTFTATATGNVPEFYLAKSDNTSTGNVYLTQVKLETGSTDTPWTPAPEDNGTPINQGFYLQNGNAYVISVYAKSPKGTNNLGITIASNKIDYQETPVAQGWARLSWSITGDGNTEGLQNFRFESSTASSNNPVYITMPQIESGTTMSPWSPYQGEETGVNEHMANIVASGQITLVDLNDAKSLTSYISSTSPRIQIYDAYANTYTPSWASTNPVLIPNLYQTGSNTQIIGNAKSVAWDKDGTAITSGTGGYTIAASNAANPYALTISQNILTTGSPNARYNCTIVWTDTDFNVDVTTICSFDFALAQNGKGGVSSVLTNDSSIVATLADGTGGTYSGANCQSTAKIYVGGTDDTANWAFTQSASGCTATASGTPANSSTTVTAMSADTATVTFTATRSGYPTQTLQFSLAKSKQGATPTSYWMVLDTGSLQQNQAGTFSPTSINLTGKSQVGTGTPANYTGRFIIEESTNGGGAYTTKYTSAADEATKNYVPSGTTVTNIRCSFYQSGGTTVLLDQQIVPVVVNGSSTLTCYLTNDSATIATDQNGNSGVYTGTNTDIHVYDGSQEVIYDGTGTANGTWKVTASASSITAGTLTDAGNYASYGVASAITADQASITYTITGKGYSGQAISFTKIQSFSRAKTGVAPTSYWQVLDNSAIKKSIAGAYTPTSYNVTGKSQTGSATPVNQTCRIKIEYSTNSGGAYTTSANASYNASADTTTWPLNVPMSDAPSGVTNIRVSMYASGGTTTLLDQDVINIVADGATGASTTLANVYCPSGSVVRNNSGSITGQCDLYVGSTITTSGVTYQWYKYVIGNADQGGGANWLKLASGSDGGGTTGWTTSTLTIPASAIASMDTYKCIATLSGSNYTGYITVQDQSDPIQLVLVPDAGGNVFKNGTGTTKNITCKVYQAGSEIDASSPYTYTYEWTMTNADGTQNTGWVDFVIANPTANGTFTTATTGGTIPASTTYYYRYTWVTQYGETQALTSQSYATGSATATNTVTYTVPAFPANVTKANVYIGTASGSEHLQGSITTSGGGYTLTAPPTATGGTVPAGNTASAPYKTGKTVTVAPSDVTNIGNVTCSIYQ